MQGWLWSSLEGQQRSLIVPARGRVDAPVARDRNLKLMLRYPVEDDRRIVRELERPRVAAHAQPGITALARPSRADQPREITN